MHSSPFIRQGFGRISTTSEKFRPRKGLTFFANNKSQGNDEGSMNSMERNRILNYTYRSLDSEQGEYNISKNIEDVEDCEQTCNDIPSTRSCKVDGFIKFLCYLFLMFSILFIID